MDWASPYVLLWILPLATLLFLAQRRSEHPMSAGRRRALLLVRIGCVLLVLLALAAPAREVQTHTQTVIFIVDHSRSLGADGQRDAVECANALLTTLPADALAGCVSVGAGAKLLRPPSEEREPFATDPTLIEKDGFQTDLAGAIALASGLFPPGTARRLVLVTDALETRGDALEAARDAALKGVVIDTVPVHGPLRSDARVIRLRSSRARAHEGASISLTAEVESSVAGRARLRLFENGVEVESRPVDLDGVQPRAEVFRRTPEERNLYRYRVRIEGFEGDAIPENNEAMSLVEVRGRPLLLLVEGQPDEAHYLVSAMEKEGIRLHLRSPESFPASLEELATYDGVVLSDVPAFQLPEAAMARIHDYVEQLGGGFLMIGGVRSFGVGGYYRTPIEDILPVRMQPPDKEERYSTALVLVIDRSGSMNGHKIEICKSAAIATAEMLSQKDHIGVVAFDSRATWVVPMMRAGRTADLTARIATLNAGGGTNIQPGMVAATEALRAVRARVKHMIVLSDGRTRGGGYQQLARQAKESQITVSTVGVGHGADNVLLGDIATAGGGKHYATNNPSDIPRIFTQDAATHLGKLVREEAFQPQQVESHPMLAGWDAAGAPQLLGYVKTIRKSTSQVPLVTDLGDPLLAHWRFGLGKVTAFTSDCKSRWAALWIAGWPGYSQFWGQVLREMARNPQGRTMDIHLERDARGARILVDLLEDAAEFKNAATVHSDVYFVPRGALGSALKPLQAEILEQVGPGRYEGRFRPTEPGVYLVRARAGADMVSAGLVHEVSNEAVSARVDDDLLGRMAKTTGGAVLPALGGRIAAARAAHARFVDLTPWLLGLFLLLFLADLAIRRWENVLGLYDWSVGLLLRRNR